MTITNKEIIETILEVQSHSGLPIKTFYPATELLLTFQRVCDFVNCSVVEKLLDHIINSCMIEIHKNRLKRINPNIKSYDW